MKKVNLMILLIYLAVISMFIWDQKWFFNHDERIVTINPQQLQKKIQDDHFLLYIKNKNCINCLPLRYTKRALAYHNQIIYQIDSHQVTWHSKDMELGT